MIPNPSNSILGNNGQPTFEQIQQRLAQQVQENQNPNTAQQLIDLLQQSNAAMGLVPGAGAEADQTLQQLNPTGSQSMQNMQNMRQEIEQERATDEYPFYDEKKLQANFERQKRAEDRQWQGFISSYKKDMKDKINQEHKNHVTFMTATGGTPLNIGEFAQQTGYLGGNKLQEAWEAHKEEAKDKPPSTLYDDYNQTFLDTMEHRDDFDMERYNASFDRIREIQEKISEHHANVKNDDNISDKDRHEVTDLTHYLANASRDIDRYSGTSRMGANKESEIHKRNIFPNGFNPSIFENAILASDPDYYFKHNFNFNAHDVQNVTAEHHLAEVHPRTLNRIKESNLPSELKNSIINSNSLIPLYEQLADDIIEAHEAVDYTDGNKGIGNRIHEGLKEKYGFLKLEHNIKQPTISFEKLLYNKFSKSTHQDISHLKATMNAFNTHYDDDDVHRGKIFPYGIGNGLDYDIFRHLVSANEEKATINKMFKSPLDYVIDNLIAKASIKKFFSGQSNLGFQNANQRKVYSNIPTLEDLGLSVSDLQGIRNMAVRRLENRGNPSFFQPTPLRGEKVGEPLRFERDIHRAGGATIPGFTHDYKIPEDPKKEIQGTFVYPPDVAALAPAHKFLRRPDMSPNPGSPTALLGLLDKPEWRAGVLQGRSQTEGYQPHGFQQDSYVRLDGPFGYAPIGDRQSWHQGALDVLQDEEKATYSDNQPMYDVLSRLSATQLPYTVARHDEPLLDRWGGARLLVGEPMDIAHQLLKEARPHALIPNFDLRHMLNPKSDIQEQLIMQHVPHALSNAESAIEVYNQLMEEAKIRDEETDYFPLPQTQIEDYGEQHPPTFRYNSTNEVTYSPDFQDIHTGEPMDLAIDALLKRDKIYDPNAENKGQEGVDWHPGEEGVDWDSAVSSSLHPSHDLTQRHPFDYDMHEYDHHAQKLLNLMRNRDVAHLQNNENPMTEDEQFDLMDAQQNLQTSIPKNTHFPSIQNAVGYDKDGNKISTFGDGRPKFNEGSPRYQELIGDRPTVPIHTEGSFYGVPFNEETGFTRSEPMDLAMDALLKLELAPPMTQGVEEKQVPMQEDIPMVETMDENDCCEKVRAYIIQANPQADKDTIDLITNMPCEQLQSDFDYDTVANLVGCGGFSEADQMMYASEPMDLAMDVLLKDRISPEAKQHKLEYDKKYESSPERVKYREELNRERRNRGIYGKHNHMDVSHTEGGKLTLESEHGNRARHFKEKGTLRHEE